MNSKENIILIADDVNSKKSGSLMLIDLAKSINKTRFNCVLISPDASIKKRVVVSKVDGIDLISFRNGRNF